MACMTHCMRSRIGPKVLTLANSSSRVAGCVQTSSAAVGEECLASEVTHLSVLSAHCAKGRTMGCVNGRAVRAGANGRQRSQRARCALHAYVDAMGPSWARDWSEAAGQLWGPRKALCHGSRALGSHNGNRGGMEAEPCLAGVALGPHSMRRARLPHGWWRMGASLLRRSACLNLVGLVECRHGARGITAAFLV